MRSERALWKRRALVRATLSVLVVAGHASLAANPAHAQSGIDPRRSLAVTEQPILERFPLQRVLDQLVAQSGVRGLTSLALFRQWWDTQNPGPGLGLGPNCDDEQDATGRPIVNTFPYLCRPHPAEGGEVNGDPFAGPADHPGAYIPIGLFNRFDVAPADGSHCGEHRIVYARRSGVDSGLNRNLLIFEAILPNPVPAQGLRGCTAIALFWASLTREDSLARRADALERFYFRGMGPIPPVVHVNHYGNNALGAGQIRTNQFMQTVVGEGQPRTWTLREFTLRRACSGPRCTALTLVPVTNKENPFGPLFDPDGTHPRAPAFRRDFAAQVASLAAGTVPGIAFPDLADVYNSGQSQASGSDETDYSLHFGAEASPLRSEIQTALDALGAGGNGLSPDDIVARAQALSCAGCHRRSNGAELGGGLTWPPSLGFTHVSERETEVVDGVRRFVISAALTDVFLPKRKQVLDDFLNGLLPRVPSPRAPIGGRRTH